LKSCPDCGQSKPLDDFPPAKRRTDGRGTYCRHYMSARSRASYRRKVEATGRTVREAAPTPAGTKRCPDCEQFKRLDDFPRSSAAKDGRHTYCKPCHNHRGRETRHRLYGGSRNYHLVQRYGITAAQYDAMLAAQDGRCALCRERLAEHVDHDHVFGNVRGLLCSCCNQGLGNFRDQLAVVRAAADYLERTTWSRHQEGSGVYRLTSSRPAAAASPSSSALQHLISSRHG